MRKKQIRPPGRPKKETALAIAVREALLPVELKLQMCEEENVNLQNEISRQDEQINLLNEEVVRLTHKWKFEGLTKLYRREAFEEVVRKMFSQQGKRKEDTPVGAFVLLDVKGLGKTNNKFGHRHGDILIRKAAGALRSQMRGKEDVEEASERDRYCRHGGDEFGAFLKGVSSEARLIQILESIQTRAREIGIDFYIGWALSKPGDTYDAMYQRADIMLGKAKDKIKVEARTKKAEELIHEIASHIQAGNMDKAKNMLIPHLA